MDAAEDEDAGLFFDIIGFDPRSVGYTTPKLECFPDYLSRQYWLVQGAAGEAIPSTDASLTSKLSHAIALTFSLTSSKSSPAATAAAIHTLV